MKRNVQTYNGEDIKYLRGLLGNEDVETFLRLGNKFLLRASEERKTCERVRKCLEVMEKYGDNRWWLSEDKNVLGYYQLKESLLLVDWHRFVGAVSSLLGRSVYTHDFYDIKALRSEAERAFNGMQDSEEKKAETIKKSLESVINLGKPVIGVVVE